MPRANHRPAAIFVHTLRGGLNYVVTKKYRKYVTRKRKEALASRRINRRKSK